MRRLSSMTMAIPVLLAGALAIGPVGAGAQSTDVPQPSEQQAGDVPAQNTILRVQLDSPVKVKRGTTVRAHTVEPLYRSSELLIPAGAPVTGRVTSVAPVSRDKRLEAMSHGDFTPLREATIQFDGVDSGSGCITPIMTAPAGQSGDVLRFQSSVPKHQSFFAKTWGDLTNRRRQAVSMVTAPGKMERLKSFVYSQLPWHPQAIERGTQYDVTLLQPIMTHASRSPVLAVAREGELKEPSVLHARLRNGLSSKTAKRNDAVAAIITQPLLDREGKVEIPQGATLRGRILRVQAAKKWGRNGALRFTFNQVDFPQGSQQQVAGVPTALDGSQSGGLKLDAEGGVQPDTNKGILLPLATGLLAASSFFDEDAGLGKIAASSNGFGLITRLVAVSTGSKIFGGVVGSIATARLIYTRFLGHGRDVAFARDSEVEVEVGPIHKLRPANQQ